MALGLFNNLAPYHLLVYSLAFGTNVFHSYINAPVLFKNLPREDFSHVTNLILPKYFLAEAIVPIGLYLTLPAVKDVKFQRASLVLLGVSSFFQILNYFWILPKVQQLKKTRLILEDRLKSAEGVNAGTVATEGDALLTEEDLKHTKLELKAMSKQFGKYHGISLLFNMITTISLAGYGFVLTNGLLKFVPRAI